MGGRWPVEWNHDASEAHVDRDGRCRAVAVRTRLRVVRDAVMRDPGRQCAARRWHRRAHRRPTRIARARACWRRAAAERLLISGVNPQIRRESLCKLSGLDEEKFNCCVDLDYAADTIGNATETRRWAEALHYNRLIVVTASYHMPRSLAELARVMPDTSSFRIRWCPKDLRRHVWWLDSDRNAHSRLRVPEVPSRCGAPRLRRGAGAVAQRSGRICDGRPPSQVLNAFEASCSALRSSVRRRVLRRDGAVSRARLVAVLGAAQLGHGGSQDARDRLAAGS